MNNEADPVQYDSRQVNLSLEHRLGRRSYHYLVHVAFYPEDKDLSVEMSEMIETGEEIASVGISGIDLYAQDIGSVVEYSSEVARAALALTQDHYPDISIRLDPELTPYSRDIFDDCEPDPLRLF